MRLSSTADCQGTLYPQHLCSLHQPAGAFCTRKQYSLLTLASHCLSWDKACRPGLLSCGAKHLLVWEPHQHLYAAWHAQISADMDVSPGGRVSFREDDSYSLNLAPITVQVGPFQCPSLCNAMRQAKHPPMLR